jgi:thiamine pyrophosphate-dependent acetolactate synthase large subunit-like protein
MSANDAANVSQELHHLLSMIHNKSADEAAHITSHMIVNFVAHLERRSDDHVCVRTDAIAKVFADAYANVYTSI